MVDDEETRDDEFEIFVRNDTIEDVELIDADSLETSAKLIPIGCSRNRMLVAVALFLTFTGSNLIYSRFKQKHHLTSEDDLSSFTYSNCPFILVKFNQHLLAKKGPFTSKNDRLMNSEIRAQWALDFSNNAHAYKRVVHALENNAFDGRKIMFDGDSLTRQSFISLGCLAWNAGYVEDYDVPIGINLGGANKILNNAHYDANFKHFQKGYIRLKGGGELYYVDMLNESKIPELSKRMINTACDEIERGREYKTRLNFGNDLLAMNERDVIVFGAGKHAGSEELVSTYQRVFQCVNDTNTTDTLWPHMMYQLNSVASFWTDSHTVSGIWKDGLDEIDKQTCQISVNTDNCREKEQTPCREEERTKLGGLGVPFIGDTIDLENLGQYHVWHGDCLHWIQPGIPDVYAGELADYLILTNRT